MTAQGDKVAVCQNVSILGRRHLPHLQCNIALFAVIVDSISAATCARSSVPLKDLYWIMCVLCQAGEHILRFWQFDSFILSGQLLAAYGFMCLVLYSHAHALSHGKLAHFMIQKAFLNITACLGLQSLGPCQDTCKAAIRPLPQVSKASVISELSHIPNGNQSRKIIARHPLLVIPYKCELQ